MKKTVLRSRIIRLAALFIALLLTCFAAACAVTPPAEESASTADFRPDSTEPSILPESSAPEESSTDSTTEDSATTSTVWQPKLPEEHPMVAHLIDTYPLGTSSLVYGTWYSFDFYSDSKGKETVHAHFATKYALTSIVNLSFISLRDCSPTFVYHHSTSKTSSHVPYFPSHESGRYFHTLGDTYYGISYSGRPFYYVDGAEIAYLPQVNPYPGEDLNGSFFGAGQLGTCAQCDHLPHSGILLQVLPVLIAQNGEPVMTKGGFYDLEGHVITDLPFDVRMVEGEGLRRPLELIINGHSVAQADEVKILSTTRSSVLVELKSSVEVGCTIREYDLEGNPIHALKFGIQQNGLQPHALPGEDGKMVDALVHTYTLTAGDLVLEDVVKYQFCLDANGRPNLIVAYPDRLEWYSIQDYGYADVSFSQP